jgi:hypothetical protein
MSGWYLLLMFVPLVNWVVLVVLCYALARSFGKGIGFTFGLFFFPPIFSLILGFGRAEYIDWGEKR